MPSLSFQPVAVGGGLTIEILGESEFTSKELLESGRSHSRPQLEEAMYVLFSILAEGPVLAGEVRRLASYAGVAPRTLRRCKEILGVRSLREGFGPGSRFYWALPEHSETVCSWASGLDFRLDNAAKLPP